MHLKIGVQQPQTDSSINGLLSQKTKQKTSTTYQHLISVSDKKELTPSGVCVLNNLNNTLPRFVEKNVCKVQKPYKPIVMIFYRSLKNSIKYE